MSDKETVTLLTDMVTRGCQPDIKMKGDKFSVLIWTSPEMKEIAEGTGDTLGEAVKDAFVKM